MHEYDIELEAMDSRAFVAYAPYVISEQKTEQLLPENVINTHLAIHSYDHSDRLLSIKEKVSSGANNVEEVTLAQRYNALGQLKSKWFHSEDAKKFRVRTDYTHNIRGWVTEGKTVYKKDEMGPDLPYYGINLAYANGANYTNGNISQMQWLGKDEAAFSKGLSFSYDGANRLLGSTGLNGYLDTEKGISYDKSGNIKTLVRAGAAVDNLSYGYTGNRLSTVTDGSGSNLGVKNGVSSYAYDDNGNMINDGNRGATLTYNYLNLPKTIKIGAKTFTYDYDATGTKHKYAGDTLTLKYAGAFEYRQVGAANQLYRVGLREGQAVFRDGKLRFEYSLKDHLGNVRVVFDGYGQVLQKTDYYAFGLEIDRNVPVKPMAARNAVNRYTFQGQEKQIGSDYMQFKWRLHDPLTGRFMQVDPLSEKYPFWTTYAFSGNIVINARELEGLEPYIVTGRSFIPANSVPNPMAPMSNTKSFKGDNRQSYQANAASFRTEQKVRVDFDNKKVSTLSNVASGSIGVDNKGLDTEKSLATKAGPNPSYDKGLLEKGNSTTIGMQVDASNKLVNGAPAINYDVNITISQQSNGSLDYKINGASDGFPAYEFFITNEATGNSTLIYGSNPIKTGDTPMALFPPMERKINSSGNINDRKKDEQH